MSTSCTKRSLVRQISIETAENQAQVREIIQRFLRLLADGLLRDGHVELRGFGVFTLVMRAPRFGRVPTRPGEQVRIPARLRTRFIEGRALRQRLHEKQFEKARTRWRKREQKAEEE